MKACVRGTHKATKISGCFVVVSLQGGGDVIPACIYICRTVVARDVQQTIKASPQMVDPRKLTF